MKIHQLPGEKKPTYEQLEEMIVELIKYAEEIEEDNAALRSVVTSQNIRITALENSLTRIEQTRPRISDLLDRMKVLPLNGGEHYMATFPNPQEAA